MELRIVRSFKWERVPGQEVRFGGPPPSMRLVPIDVLQHRYPEAGHLPATPWVDVPVVEMEKPPHPHEKTLRCGNRVFRKTGE